MEEPDLTYLRPWLVARSDRGAPKSEAPDLADLARWLSLQSPSPGPITRARWDPGSPIHGAAVRALGASHPRLAPAALIIHSWWTKNAFCLRTLYNGCRAQALQVDYSALAEALSKHFTCPSYQVEITASVATKICKQLNLVNSVQLRNKIKNIWNTNEGNVKTLLDSLNVPKPEEGRRRRTMTPCPLELRLPSLSPSHGSRVRPPSLSPPPSFSPPPSVSPVPLSRPASPPLAKDSKLFELHPKKFLNSVDIDHLVQQLHSKGFSSSALDGSFQTRHNLFMDCARTILGPVAKRTLIKRLSLIFENWWSKNRRKLKTIYLKYEDNFSQNPLDLSQNKGDISPTVPEVAQVIAQNVKSFTEARRKLSGNRRFVESIISQLDWKTEDQNKLINLWNTNRGNIKSLVNDYIKKRSKGVRSVGVGVERGEGSSEGGRAFRQLKLKLDELVDKPDKVDHYSISFNIKHSTKSKRFNKTLTSLGKFKLNSYEFLTQLNIKKIVKLLITKFPESQLIDNLNKSEQQQLFNWCAQELLQCQNCRDSRRLAAILIKWWEKNKRRIRNVFFEMEQVGNEKSQKIICQKKQNEEASVRKIELSVTECNKKLKLVNRRGIMKDGLGKASYSGRPKKIDSLASAALEQQSPKDFSNLLDIFEISMFLFTKDKSTKSVKDLFTSEIFEELTQHLVKDVSDPTASPEVSQNLPDFCQNNVEIIQKYFDCFSSDLKPLWFDSVVTRKSILQKIVTHLKIVSNNDFKFSSECNTTKNICECLEIHNSCKNLDTLNFIWAKNLFNIHDMVKTKVRSKLFWSAPQLVNAFYTYINSKCKWTYGQIKNFKPSYLTCRKILSNLKMTPTQQYISMLQSVWSGNLQNVKTSVMSKIKLKFNLSDTSSESSKTGFRTQKRRGKSLAVVSEIRKKGDEFGEVIQNQGDSLMKSSDNEKVSVEVTNSSEKVAQEEIKLPAKRILRSSSKVESKKKNEENSVDDDKGNLLTLDPKFISQLEKLKVKNDQSFEQKETRKIYNDNNCIMDNILKTKTKSKKKSGLEKVNFECEVSSKLVPNGKLDLKITDSSEKLLKQRKPSRVRSSQLNEPFEVKNNSSLELSGENSVLNQSARSRKEPATEGNVVKTGLSDTAAAQPGLYEGKTKVKNKEKPEEKLSRPRIRPWKITDPRSVETQCNPKYIRRRLSELPDHHNVTVASETSSDKSLPKFQNLHSNTSLKQTVNVPAKPPDTSVYDFDPDDDPNVSEPPRTQGHGIGFHLSNLLSDDSKNKNAISTNKRGFPDNSLPVLRSEDLENECSAHIQATENLHGESQLTLQDMSSNCPSTSLETSLPDILAPKMLCLSGSQMAQNSPEIQAISSQMIYDSAIDGIPKNNYTDFMPDSSCLTEIPQVPQDIYKEATDFSSLPNESLPYQPEFTFNSVDGLTAVHPQANQEQDKAEEFFTNVENKSPEGTLSEPVPSQLSEIIAYLANSNVISTDMIPLPTQEEPTEASFSELSSYLANNDINSKPNFNTYFEMVTENSDHSLTEMTINSMDLAADGLFTPNDWGPDCSNKENKENYVPPEPQTLNEQIPPTSEDDDAQNAILDNFTDLDTLYNETIISQHCTSNLILRFKTLVLKFADYFKRKTITDVFKFEFGNLEEIHELSTGISEEETMMITAMWNTNYKDIKNMVQSQLLNDTTCRKCEGITNENLSPAEDYFFNKHHFLASLNIRELAEYMFSVIEDFSCLDVTTASSNISIFHQCARHLLGPKASEKILFHLALILKSWWHKDYKNLRSTFLSIRCTKSSKSLKRFQICTVKKMADALFSFITSFSEMQFLSEDDQIITKLIKAMNLKDSPANRKTLFYICRNNVSGIQEILRKKFGEEDNFSENSLDTSLKKYPAFEKIEQSIIKSKNSKPQAKVLEISSGSVSMEKPKRGRPAKKSASIGINTEPGESDLTKSHPLLYRYLTSGNSSTWAPQGFKNDILLTAMNRAEILEHEKPEEAAYSLITIHHHITEKGCSCGIPLCWHKVYRPAGQTNPSSVVNSSQLIFVQIVKPDLSSIKDCHPTTAAGKDQQPAYNRPVVVVQPAKELPCTKVQMVNKTVIKLPKHPKALDNGLFCCPKYYGNTRIRPRLLIGMYYRKPFDNMIYLYSEQFKTIVSHRDLLGPSIDACIAAITKKNPARPVLQLTVSESCHALSNLIQHDMFLTVRLADYDSIVLPYYVNKSWSVLLASVKNKEIYLYRPCPTYDKEDYFGLFFQFISRRNYMTRDRISLDNWKSKLISAQRHVNPSDTGIYILYFLQCAILGEKPVDYLETKLYRCLLQALCLQSSDNVTSICFFCGNYINFLNIGRNVKCQFCLRHVHWSCCYLDNPSFNVSEYICVFCSNLP